MVLYRHNGIPIGMQNNEIFSTTNVDEWIARRIENRRRRRGTASGQHRGQSQGI